MLKILHASDIHLDAPYASLPAAEAQERRRGQRRLLKKLAETAREKQADLVLLAGDLFDSREVYRETLDALAAAMEEMGVPVAVAPGNHDCYHAHSLYDVRTWPDNVILFRRETPEHFSFPGFDLYGSAFTGSSRRTGPLTGFTAEKTEGKPAIGVFHGEVGKRESVYGPILTEEIAASHLTYLALGHIHTTSGLSFAGKTAYAYSGCPEGRGFDETGEKGALLVSVDEEEKVTAEFLPMAERKYEILTCRVTGKDPKSAVTEALTGGNYEDICRIILTGEADFIDRESLLRACEPLRRKTEIADHTVLPLSVWARESEDSLTGLFLRHVRAEIERAQDEEDREKWETAARFGLAALEKREDCNP